MFLLWAGRNTTHLKGFENKNSVSQLVRVLDCTILEMKIFSNFSKDCQNIDRPKLKRKKKEAQSGCRSNVNGVTSTKRWIFLYVKPFSEILQKKDDVCAEVPTFLSSHDEKRSRSSSWRFDVNHFQIRSAIMKIINLKHVTAVGCGYEERPK